MAPDAQYERIPMTRTPSPPTSPVSSYFPHNHHHTRRRRCCCLYPFPSPRPTRILAVLFWSIKFLVPLLLLLALGLLFLYEPHIEISFYSRGWIKQEVLKLEPLAGCFNPDRVHEKYNVTEFVYGPKKVEVHAGIPLKFGLDCYNFAGTIQSRPGSNKVGGGEGESGTGIGIGEGERTLYHSYWRNDLAPFGHRQEWMIKSFFATQNAQSTKLILWSNGNLGDNDILQAYLKKYPQRFELRVVDMQELAKGTLLEGSERLKMKDKKAWLDGDLLRLMLLWNFGGVWVDMDSLFTRDLDPLLEHEFVTQWDCYDKPYAVFNGALLRFRQYSPYLCEAFHIMANSTPPRPASTDWGSTLYLKVWRRVVAAAIPPFKVLPFCFGEGRSCRLDNRIPDPFKPDPEDGLWTEGLSMAAGGGLDKALQNVFVVHLHNQWDKQFPQDGWVDRLLLRKYDRGLGN